jgi:hypothetical protein
VSSCVGAAAHFEPVDAALLAVDGDGAAAGVDPELHPTTVSRAARAATPTK